MKHLSIIFIFASLFFISGCSEPEIASIRDDESIGVLSPEPQVSNEIFIEKGGLEPKAIEIGVGSVVSFINLDDESHIIASDPHPEHDELPGLYSQPIFQSESYEYKFDKTGEFGFHIEENPSFSGKIIVK